MFDAEQSRRENPNTVVIGAGMGGLATALRLQSAGHQTTLLDTHAWPGGKARAIASDAGPVDAGPTVLTMRHVFDELFAATGAPLEAHVTLIAEPLLARHFWPDGTTLDLFANHAQNEAAIAQTFGISSAKEYARFSREARALFDMFEGPMMQAATPKLADLARVSLRHPSHLSVLTPFATLERHLRNRFSDPRLVQLFARYATYVGGHPNRSPAILSLIWHAEASGVWRVQGGMHSLAKAMAERFQAMGGSLRLACPAAEIETDGETATGVKLTNGQTLVADQVVFAGDPRALAKGALGNALCDTAPQTLNTARSLSARVWSFAAKAEGDIDLAHHNVFFAARPNSEFDAIAAGQTPTDPTLYVCAEDRGSTAPLPNGLERFEIILNAAPLTEARPTEHEVTQCRQTTFQTLQRFGLSFSPAPADSALSTPTTFETLFPQSAGALYGQSPHGMTASLKRPRARTKIKGLYLAGGGTHPGAGVPMAALSGKHAAEAILKDLALT